MATPNESTAGLPTTPGHQRTSTDNDTDAKSGPPRPPGREWGRLGADATGGPN